MRPALVDRDQMKAIDAEHPIAILLVEDSPGDAMLVQQALSETRGSHFEVVAVERLAEAIREVSLRRFDTIVLDLSLPGVEVRPTTTITGERKFSEIFLRDVAVPKEALLGEVDQGWSVAMTTLTSERAGVATLHLGVNGKILQLIDEVRERDGSIAGRKRERLAKLYLHGRLRACRAPALGGSHRMPGRFLAGLGRAGPADPGGPWRRRPRSYGRTRDAIAVA